MVEIDINQVRRITELPEASSLTGIEVIELVQSNSSYKTTIDKIRGASSYNTLVGTVLDFSKNVNYTISLTKNTTISVANAVPGDVRVINTVQSGAYSLILPSGHYKMGGWDVVTPTANNVISYTVLYDGLRHLWTRAAYEA